MGGDQVLPFIYFEHAKFLQLCKANFIIIILIYARCYSWNIKRKSLNNKAIVPNEMKLVEEMIKGKGPRGQKISY
jgi:hypothetical protein